jgi:hypothetical protein
MAVISYTYIVDGYEATYSFASASLLELWKTEVSVIKEQVSLINSDGGSWPDRLPKCVAWRMIVSNFIEEWGVELLPPDVKVYVNAVERYLEVTLTVWAEPPENFRT